ncbi:MAG: tRNA (guanosine(46)-N7)-methyltransferase TrmB [Planctomycetaceae bacterium]|jgi:tRNA (guanine-N7-)-methyltransferase|nr:tRNA (guanosine(46)-N7)-methyltransferase TrmB [Planctomycetaceae bacterium]
MMPRRGVKTISDNADLSSVLKLPEDLSKPLDMQQVFRRFAPLELEIGSGKGMFINKAAKERPEHNFLGIEIGKKYARFSAANLLRNKLTNARMICGDAAAVLRDWIEPNSLFALHIYFPDPWWKRAHRKRRILRTDVVSLIESRLQSGGTLHFWTDVEEYFQSALKLLSAETNLTGPLDDSETPQADGGSIDYNTHFERRTLLHGEKVFRAEYRKRTGETK